MFIPLHVKLSVIFYKEEGLSLCASSKPLFSKDGAVATIGL